MKPYLPVFESMVEGDVCLRLAEAADAPDLFHLTDTHRDYLREWLPWVDASRTLEDTLNFITQCQNEFQQGERLTACIWHQDKIVGVIGLHHLDWPNRSTLLGYWLEPTRQGKGIMTRSCRLLVRYVFQQADLNRVEIRCATGNQKSRAIPERLKFQCEGTIREGEWLNGRFVDLVQYGMLRREWNESNSQ